jgi:predicted TIM-barrel enzyme
MWTRDDFLQLIQPAAVGMIHLQAMPGSPRWGGDMDTVIAAALADADAQAGGGLGAAMIENYHDGPFFPGRVPAETVAAMTVVIQALMNFDETVTKR